jgi:outer membrane protein
MKRQFGFAFLLVATFLGRALSAHAQAAAPHAQAAAPEGRPITLAEAVAMAEKNAPRVVEARGAARTTQAATRSAYAAFLPSLTLSAGATRQLPYQGDRTRIENGQVVTLPAEPWTYNTGAVASLQLFDGGRRLFQLKQSKAEEDQAESDEVAQRFGAILNAKQQYFNILAAREGIQAARSEIEQAEQQFHAASLRLRAGTATRSDSLRSEIQLQSARLSLSEAQNALRVANASLTRAVGASEPVTAAGDDTLSLVGLSLGEAGFTQLAERGPAVLQAEAALDAARAGKKVPRTGYLPALSASYSYSGSGTDSQFGFGDEPFSYNGSLRLSLSYPLFDQLNREEDVVRVDVAEENAKAALRDAKLAAHETLAQILGSYRSAEERVLTQTATLQTAEEDLRVQQRRYQLGASTLLDLLTSQSQVNQAREALIRARYDQRVAKAELEALVGRAL